MLYYKVHKCNKLNAPWVTFIHGAGGSSNIWFKQLRAFTVHFNVLLVDLRGHGKSSMPPNVQFKTPYTFDDIATDVIDVLKELKIFKSFFVGISLGSIIIRVIAEKFPTYVNGMILGGAIIRFNFKSRFLVKMGNLTKRFIPYMWLYKIFAFIIMPKKNHKESRLVFINEAKRLCHKEFIRWFKLTYDLIPLMRIFREKDVSIPTLYIMGEQDHLFLKPVKEVVSLHKSAELAIIANCGHVVNVEQPDFFNQLAINYIRKQQK